MTVETEVAALTTAVNSLTSTVNVSKATLDASVAAAEAAYDSFDDRYLGVKSSAPSTDNDGGALLTGALYFNSTNNTMNVFTGSAWAPVANNNIINPNVALTQDLATNGNDVKFGDNDKATFGASDDLQIYHSGIHSYITDTGAGNLYLGGSDLVWIGAGDLSETYATFNDDGAVNLRHNNSPRLATTSSGISVTGGVDVNGPAGSSASLGEVFQLGQVDSAGGFITSVDWSTNVYKPIQYRASSHSFLSGTSQKLNVNSTGIDVTGTATMDGLTVDGSALLKDAAVTLQLRSADGTSNGYNLKANVSDSNDFGFIIEDKDQKDLLKVSSNNDISFYEDTGTTPKFFWDASAESLGIGTSSATAPLTIVATANQIPVLGAASSHAAIGSGGFGTMIGTKSTGVGYIQQQRFDGIATAYSLGLQPNGGNVGIGTSSPDKLLEVSSNSAPTIRISNTRGDSNWDTDPVFGALEFYSYDTSGSGPSVRASVKAEAFTAFGNATDLVFRNGDSQGVQQETLRIDYLGRVGIGTDSPSEALHVKDTSEFLVDVAASDSAAEFKSNLGNSWRIGNDSSLNAFAITQAASLSTDVRFFIANGGNVGIGTSLPSAALEVAGNIQLSAGADRGIIGPNFRSLNIFANPNSSTEGIKFSTDGGTTTEVFIQDGGNVGIGTDSPTSRLTVASGTDATNVGDGIHFLGSSINNQAAIQSFNTGAYDGDLRFYTSDHGSASTSIGTERMRIDSSGVTTFKGEVKISTAANKKLSFNDDGGTFRAGIQAVTTGGQMIASSIANDFAIRSQSNMLFAAGGNPERMRIDSGGRLLVGQTAVSTGGTNGDDAKVYVNGAVVREGVIFDDFDNVWVQDNGAIIEGRSNFNPSNKPNTENWFFVTTGSIHTGGLNVYCTQTATSITGRIYTRYNNNVTNASGTGTWSSWVEK